MNKNKYTSLILSIGGVVGVCATTAAAIKATPLAIDLINEDKKKKEDDSYTKMDAFKASWKCYIPTGILGMLTISTIVANHIVTAKERKAVVAAYLALNESYKKYVEGSKQVFGEDAKQKIDAEIAKETFVYSQGVFMDSSTYDSDNDHEETMLFFDSYSQRYFETTLARVINAEYHINRNLMLGGFASINSYFEFLGIETISEGDEVGWCQEDLCDGGLYWLDFNNEMTELEDGLECCVITYIIDPALSISDEL